MRGEVRIATTAYADLLAEVRRVQRNLETGGILVGWPERGLVTRFIAAGNGSRRSFGHFVRSAADVQALLDEAVAHGEGVYMGEAHVHPDAGRRTERGRMHRRRCKSACGSSRPCEGRFTKCEKVRRSRR